MALRHIRVSQKLTTLAEQKGRERGSKAGAGLVKAKGCESGEIRDPTLSALRTEGREGGGEGAWKSGECVGRRGGGEEGR